MEIGFLLGLVLFVFGGLHMLNPANPIPDDKKNFGILKEKLKEYYIWGNKEQ
tara:strand:+ start:2739 stop:2894 length:156 start_codon:yes stop_codon:yes gene_type:complete